MDNNTVLRDMLLKNLDKQTFDKIVKEALEAFIKRNDDALKEKVIDRTKAIEDMYDFVHGKFLVRWLGEDKKITASSDCILAIITCCIDVVAIVLQLAGVPESITKACATEIISDCSQEALTGLEQIIKQIEEATSNTAKAKAIFELFAGIYKITGIRQILGAIEHNMAWYEWVIMGTVITAQITAWIATDGIAFIAELAILGALLAQIVADAVLTVQKCGN